MKKYIAILIVCIMSLSLCACANGAGQAEKTETENTVSKPELSQIRSICELATLECYYHNVAKSTKTKGTGLAHVGEKEVKTIDEDDYISTSDSWFNKNQITADEQTQAVNDAQNEMVAAVEKNKALLVSAQERAKTLIENYVTQLGEATGIEYQITWKYDENEAESTVGDDTQVK